MPRIAPPTTNGSAVAAIEPKFFANLCAALQCTELAASQLDDEAQPRLRTAFAAAFARRTRDEWVDLLSGADTCVAPVLEIHEVAAHPAIRRSRHRHNGDSSDRGFVSAAGPAPGRDGARRRRGVARPGGPAPPTPNTC